MIHRAPALIGRSARLGCLALLVALGCGDDDAESDGGGSETGGPDGSTDDGSSTGPGGGASSSGAESGDPEGTDTTGDTVDESTSGEDATAGTTAAEDESGGGSSGDTGGSSGDGGSTGGEMLEPFPCEWSEAVDLSTRDDSSLAFPRGANNDAGEAIVVWHQSTLGQTDVWGARYDADTGTWLPAELIEDDPVEFGSGPVVAIDPIGAATVVWNSETSVGARRFEPRDGWLTPVELGDGGTQWDPLLVLEGGDVLAGWRDAGDVAVRQFDAGAGTWGDAATLGNGNAWQPRFATTGAGRVVGVWSQWSPASGDVVVVSSYDPDDGEWTPTLDLGPGTTPEIAANEDGELVVAWSGIGGGARARRFSTDAGRWSDEQLLHEGQFQPAPLGLEVGMDEHGNALVAWSRTEPGEFAEMLVFRGVGEDWEELPPIESPEDASTWVWTMAMNPTGNAILVWEQTGGVHTACFEAATEAWTDPVELELPGDLSFFGNVELSAEGDAILPLLIEPRGSVWDRVYVFQRE